MSLCVVHISGPSRAGKTTLARCLARHLAPNPPHHLRMVRIEAGPPESLSAVESIPGMFESRQYTYSSERVFEQLPAALKSIKQVRRWATVLLETDVDPSYRHAHSYDVRVFVAPGARAFHEVFRTSHEAARAMNTIMQDTLAFAHEIFGLVPNADLDDSRTGLDIPLRRPSTPGAPDPRSLGGLLQSTIGGEIISRIQFQPDYHAVVDSDVVLINAARGGAGPVVDDVARHMEKLLSRLGRPPGREPMLAVCDLMDDDDPLQRQAIGRMIELIEQVKADWP